MSKYAEKYRQIKVRMHLVTYGTDEYKKLKRLLDFYYIKMQGE